MARKLEQVANGGPPEPVQALVIVAHYAEMEPRGLPGPGTCEIDLWRRIPHPDSQVPGGPELDVVLAGDRCVIFGEAKWQAVEGKGQGLHGNKTQLQLRSEFFNKYGGKIYGDRRFYVLLITLDQEGAPDSQEPSIARLTWDDLCAYSIRTNRKTHAI